MSTPKRFYFKTVWDDGTVLYTYTELQRSHDKRYMCWEPNGSPAYDPIEDIDKCIEFGSVIQDKNSHDETIMYLIDEEEWEWMKIK